MKIILSVIAVCLATFVSGQGLYSWYTQSANNNVMVDLAGSPAKLKKKLDVAGSPFNNDEYCEATFYNQNGRAYVGVPSKLNFQTNTISFIKGTTGEEAEKEYTPAFYVPRIEFTGCGETKSVFQSGFPAIGLQTENSYYQVLDSGKTMLLKHTLILESRNPINGFNSNATTTVLDQVNTYYVYSKEKGMSKISKSNDDVLKTLTDKRKEVDSYMASNSLKVKKEDDLVKVFQYYNSLK